MRPIPPNPFLDATFAELCQAISETVRVLERRTFTSRDAKDAFAERTRYLLLACGMRFMNAGASIPGSPEMPLDRDPRHSVSECFLPWYRQQVQLELTAVRTYTLWRAANCVLGRDACDWLDPHDVLWSLRRSYIGTLDGRKARESPS